MFLIVLAAIANVVLSGEAYRRMPWTWTTALRTGPATANHWLVDNIFMVG
jgi:hypothetical protein